MAGVSAGELDREVTIQQLTESRGNSGFPIESWATLDIEWMAKFELRGDERFKAGAISASYDNRWQMHYREDMDPETVDVAKVRRLVYAGRVYEITAASHMGRQEKIELFTLAKVG